jgi:hypothetical protein
MLVVKDNLFLDRPTCVGNRAHVCEARGNSGTTGKVLLEITLDDSCFFTRSQDAARLKNDEIVRV